MNAGRRMAVVKEFSRDQYKEIVTKAADEPRSSGGGRNLPSTPVVYIPAYAAATPPVPGMPKQSKPTLLLADDVDMSDIDNDEDIERWRMFLTPAHMATSNEAAEEEIKFTKLARHF